MSTPPLLICEKCQPPFTKKGIDYATHDTLGFEMISHHAGGWYDNKDDGHTGDVSGPIKRQGKPILSPAVTTFCQQYLQAVADAEF